MLCQARVEMYTHFIHHSPEVHSNLSPSVQLKKIAGFPNTIENTACDGVTDRSVSLHQPPSYHILGVTKALSPCTLCSHNTIPQMEYMIIGPVGQLCTTIIH